MKKKIFLSLIIIGVIITGFSRYILIPKTHKNISDYFISVGFENAEIYGTSFSLNGLYIKKIHLDKDGFNVANDTKIKIFWPSYFFTSTIKSVSIDTIKVSSVANSPRDVLRYKDYFKIDGISNAPIKDLTVKNIIWDIATPKNSLRIKGNINITKKDNSKLIQANLTADQYELIFNSTWSGILNSDKSINLNGNYDRLSIHSKAVNLNRGTGWITIKGTAKNKIVAAQLDAGSGAILGAPVSNISLLIDKKDNAFPVILRATVSGVEKTELYGDFTFSGDVKKQSFEVLLDMNSPSKFAAYLNKQKIVKNIPNKTNYPTTKTQLLLSYLAEDRFADGPFPFSLKSNTNDKETLNGTFLVYPKSLDVRGTAQGRKDIISFLQTIFSINEEHVSEETIRFNQNLKSLL